MQPESLDAAIESAKFIKGDFEINYNASDERVALGIAWVSAYLFHCKRTSIRVTAFKLIPGAQ